MIAFWRWLALSLVVVFGLVTVAEILPSPLPASAPATVFSEARAWETVEVLSRRIGHRISGTDGQRAAAEHLRAQLAAIPGIEVVTQTDVVVDDPDNWGTLFDASVTNVVARLPGERTDAIVVSAHYDSPPESVGAADNALAVAATLEVARTLAAGPKLHATVIFNFNDGEEVGSLGADAFLRHAWRKDVRAFINLDAAGAAGRALLFQTGAGSVALARAYAAAPRPLGTVVAQDIFQSGIVPSSTDYVVYAGEGKLPGLDLALYQDGYAYHTDRDQPERITRGTLQHLGDNLVGTLRALRLQDVAPTAGTPPPWYFDVLGRWMLVIPAGLGAWLPWLCLVVGLAACVVSVRRASLRVPRVVLAFAIMLFTMFAAVLSAAAVAFAVGLVRPHGWYAHPWLVLTYVALALVVFVALVKRACPRLVSPGELAVGSLGLWMALLVLAAYAGAGSAYLAIAWVLALAATIVFAERAPAVRFVAWGVAALLLAEPALIVIQVFLPIAGRLPLAVSFDPFAAVLVALPAVLGVIALAAPLATAPIPRRARWAVGGAIVIGLALLALVPPFTADRPQRIAAEYACTPAGCNWRVDSEDSLGAAQAVGTGTEAWPRPRPDPPRVTVTPGSTTTAGREVWLDIEPAETLDVTLTLPNRGIVAWSEPVPVPRYDEASVILRRVSPRQPWRVRLTVSPGKPLQAQIKHRWTRSPGVRGTLLQLMPDWCTIDSTVSWTTDLSL
jgi:hypothetical protein